MKNLIKIVLIFMVGCCATAFAQDGKVAFVKKIVGDVLIKRGEMIVTTDVGDPIFKSDVLITKTGSSAGIVFEDGTTLAVDQNTECNIKDYLFEPETNAYAFELYLEKGKAIYHSGRIGKLAPDKISLKTPHAIVGTRGTHFIIKVD
ncbi:FecR domain-containing protein [uncultured Desulfobacter sp.]|uniref:FecR family protein n=1 Tax=uncultured Desulfobacter sp. TaxID=240139 RepID=UPI0029F51140|nr:FecR domain-containing protein [uncultured Desulfobacter sp.]